MPYRIAAGLLELLLPVEAGNSHESMRGRTLKLGAELRDAAADKPTTAAPAVNRLPSLTPDRRAKLTL
jgi:hypothetical protein